MNNMNGYERVVGKGLYSSRGVTVIPEFTDSVDFDLKDDFPIEILPLGRGSCPFITRKVIWRLFIMKIS